MSVRFAIAICAVVLGVVALAGCGSDSNNSAGSSGSTGAINEGQGSNDADTNIKPADPNDANKDTNAISSEPPPVEILTGDDTGIQVEAPTVIIARTSAESKALLKRHFSHGVKVDRNMAGTNFKDRQIVGVFLPRSARGTLAIITDVHQEGDHAVVTAVRLTKGKGCKAAGPRPRPFHIVETRKMDFSAKPVVKIDVQEGTPC